MSDSSMPLPVDILVVDDNPGKILALETALAPLAQNIVQATSGREALRQLLTRQFATVLLDVNMPDMDGFETAQMIRSRSRSAHTPIIFVSAISMDGADALRGYSLGAVDYIFAPIIPEVLRAKVSVFVELHRKTEEAKLQAQRLEERTRELEQSQRQLRLAERMASLGTLCAGLGHDMGNLLLPIMARLETTDTASLPTDTRENLDSIRTCVGYLQRLSNGLRLLALDPEGKATTGEVTVLEDWWVDVGPMLRNALPRNVTLRFQAEAGLPPVRLARHLLTQVVFNLVQNAGEALKDRSDGEVRVWAGRGPHGGTTPAQSVRVGVADNGPGMPADVLQRCFDPFFTTKTRSISTGLGLALVHSIVQRAAGRVEVASTPGQGTDFSVVLPAVSAGDAPPPPRPVAVVSLRDARVRGYASSLLSSAGFDVKQTENGTSLDARLWLTDPDGVLMDAAAGFLAGGPERRVLVYGETPPDAASGVLGFSSHPGPTALRDRLREVLRAGGASAGSAQAQPV